MTVKQQVGQWILPRLPVTRFMFDLLRTELQAWRVTICNRVLLPRRRRLQRLRGMRNLLINVACGPHPFYCRPDRHGFDELAVPDPFPTDLPSRMDVVNHIFHQWHEHRWAYDFENMADRLQRAGFARIEKMTFQRSLMPELACDAPNHAPYSLYVDAVKAARSLD